MLQLPPFPLPLTGLLLWALLCAIQDARQKRISNWLTFGMAALSSILLLHQGHSISGAGPGATLLALAIALAFSLPGYFRGEMGAGDVKLLGALALASSPMHVLGSISLAGLGMVSWAFIGSRLWQRLSPGLQQHLARLDPTSGSKLPYAPFLLLGLLPTLLLLA
ncbi:MAG: prepilin peptidase [Thiopseudomonas sp.]|nr:prepilin peptidase [Gammaproteobacteria bacterium]